MRIVTEINQAQEMLVPLLGPVAAIIFAIAFLFAGVASSVTAGMAGGSIFAGIFAEPYDARDPHSKLGVLITIIGATIAICALSFVTSPFNILIYSQVFLSQPRNIEKIVSKNSKRNCLSITASSFKFH